MEVPLSPQEKPKLVQARSERQDERDNTAAAPLIAVAKAGESIQGFVVLIVNDPKGVVASALDVTFHGEEETRGRQGNDPISQKWGFLELKLPMPSLASSVFQTYNEKEEESEPFIYGSETSEKKSKRANKIRIPTGKYQIPFSVELPKSIPGTFVHGNPSVDGCQIRYYFKAELQGSGRMWNYHKEENIHVESSGGIFFCNDYRKLHVNGLIKLHVESNGGIFSNLNNCRNLEVLHENPDPVPYNAPPVTRKIWSCFFPVGSISLAAQFDNVRVHKGQECRINISCRNHSVKEIDSVKATLRQRFNWIGCSIAGSRPQSLLSMDSTHSLFFQGSLATESKTAQQAQDISWELRDIHREVNNARHSATFTIPRNVGMMCSYCGRFITISHHLELEVSTSGRFLSPAGGRRTFKSRRS